VKYKFAFINIEITNAYTVTQKLIKHHRKYGGL